MTEEGHQGIGQKVSVNPQDIWEFVMGGGRLKGWWRDQPTQGPHAELDSFIKACVLITRPLAYNKNSLKHLGKDTDTKLVSVFTTKLSFQQMNYCVFSLSYNITAIRPTPHKQFQSILYFKVAPPPLADGWKKKTSDNGLRLLINSLWRDNPIHWTEKG